jgi:hypothetical protein
LNGLKPSGIPNAQVVSKAEAIDGYIEKSRTTDKF